ncbi:MAG TPA: PqiC family protein [Chthoniobacteraceae bacterium]|nr:PqiC family protein [Chthoniobacteraceae bacterium]
MTVILLTGCASSPKTNFYTLNVVPGETGRRSISFPVQLAAVHLPPSLDRRQMVSMTDQNSVKVSETNRWSGALDEMVRNVLSQDLAARLPKGKVILPEAPAPGNTGTLVVTIAQFGPDASGEVKLNGSWALLNAGSPTPVLERDVLLNAGPAASPDATAAAMSQALGQLANKIAAALSEE